MLVEVNDKYEYSSFNSLSSLCQSWFVSLTPDTRTKALKLGMISSVQLFGNPKNRIASFKKKDSGYH